MKTDFETLKNLASHTINSLKEEEIIEFESSNREALIDAMATEYGVCFATDEDIRDQAIEEVEEKMGEDNMPEDIAESEMFNHARKEIIKSFNGENIGGLYLVESLHQIAGRMTQFLLDTELIEDVFGTDDEISDFLVKKIRQFSPRKN
jgi:propanediol dehydratase large subunit